MYSIKLETKDDVQYLAIPVQTLEDVKIVIERLMSQQNGLGYYLETKSNDVWTYKLITDITDSKSEITYKFYLTEI